MNIKQNGIRQAQKALRQSSQAVNLSEEKFPKVFRSSPIIGNHPCENCQNRFDERSWGDLDSREGRPKRAGGEPTEADPEGFLRSKG
jgi:hypothetical protein